MIIQFQPLMLPSQPGLGWNQLPLVGQAGYIQIFWHLAAWLEKDKNAEIKGGSVALGRTDPSPFTDPAEALQPRGHQATQAHTALPFWALAEESPHS